MEAQLCPKFEEAMHLLSKRWVGLVLSELLKGPRRFSEMEANLPISGRLLSDRLKMLEKENIVMRSVYTEYPVRIEYTLTPKGEALEPVIQAIKQWSGHWVQASQHEYSK